jgi:hypothetical protein
MNIMKTEIKEETCVISPPKFGVTDFCIEGIAPLVVERFSKKAELMAKMAEGKSAGSKKNRDARDYEREAEDARYRSSDGWEGMNAAAFRAAMISACRLVGFKMTLAKLSTFIEADGFDLNDGVPLVRIYGESHTYTAHTRNATGVVDVRSRPMYRQWAAKLRVRYDTDQFKMADVLNLVSRCGLQVGIGAGRPDSKASAGCGFGLFQVVPSDREKEVILRFGIK